MLVVLLFVAGMSTVLAQQSAIYTHALTDFDKAILLFKDKQYHSAQILFERIEQDNKEQYVQEECAYYIGICAIHLNQNNADELMEKFVADYPTSSKQNQAYREVAQYYFEQGKFPQSLQYYVKVDENTSEYRTFNTLSDSLFLGITKLPKTSLEPASNALIVNSLTKLKAELAKCNFECDRKSNSAKLRYRN
jgi:tetratricopeptide (TPR) repeat protein